MVLKRTEMTYKQRLFKEAYLDPDNRAKSVHKISEELGISKPYCSVMVKHMKLGEQYYQTYGEYRIYSKKTFEKPF